MGLLVTGRASRRKAKATSFHVLLCGPAKILGGTSQLLWSNQENHSQAWVLADCTHSQKKWMLRDPQEFPVSVQTVERMHTSFHCPLGCFQRVTYPQEFWVLTGSVPSKEHIMSPHKSKRAPTLPSVSSLVKMHWVKFNLQLPPHQNSW